MSEPKASATDARHLPQAPKTMAALEDDATVDDATVPGADSRDRRDGSSSDCVDAASPRLRDTAAPRFGEPGHR